MNKFFAASVLIVASMFSSVSYATEAKPVSAATPDAAKAPAMPTGMIAHKSIADAPLPSDFVMGNKDAPIVLIEYASLSCPHCAHFATSVLPDLQKKYIDTGKVRYVLRQFPINEPAFKGAMLVSCVGEEMGAEKYYLFNKVLFDSQSKWAFDGNWQEALQTISAVGGVNKEKFDACINNKEREVKVLNAKKEAQDEIKVPHTPYFFIGGEAYNGDKSLADISKVIDGKLAAVKK